MKVRPQRSGIAAALCLAAALAAPRAHAGPAKGNKAAAKPASDTAPPVLIHVAATNVAEGQPLALEARITDASGVMLPSLYWRLSGQGDWATVPLQPATGAKDRYQATIPAAAIIGDVEYYIEAFDNLGNGPASAGKRASPLVVHLEHATLPEAATEPSVPLDSVEPLPASGPLPIAPAVLAGAGLALAVVGAVLYSGAAGAVEDLNARYGAGQGLTPGDHATALAATSRARAGSAMTIAGSLATVGGVAWFFVPAPGGGGDVPEFQAGVRGAF